MKSLLAAAFILLIFSCHPKTSERVQPEPPSPSFGTIVSGSGNTPLILEANVDGIGKALISGRSIIIKVPAGFTRETVRIDYKVSEGVKVMNPASGSEVAIRDLPARTICIQQDEFGNCTLSYQLIIETPSPLTVSVDPASLQLELNQFTQSFGFRFRLGNLRTDGTVTRRFKIRFVNRKTQYAFTDENYIVYDLAGQPIFVNQLNQPPAPNEGELRMSGMLPLAMSPGEYTVTIQVPTCYSPKADGQCFSFGYESVELAIPLAVKAGAPLVGAVNAMPSANKEVLITGRNLNPAKTVTIRMANDFTPTLVAQATVVNDTLARLVLPAGQSVGQYELEVNPEDGKTIRNLFSIPNEKPSSTFAYVSMMGSFAATQNWLPALPVFKRGESLEVRYTFATGDRSYSALVRRTVKQVRLVSTTDAKRTYEMQDGSAFYPAPLATDFLMWKWTIPGSVPAGGYALVFEDFDGSVSLPYFQKIRVQ
ncbi:hypothetical protein [Larkinella rosea]|uniref:IPT/TIG domain-containing protein n=1 Tax=Larkinella rosea TaxID=2025312 RepID=A0A3P1BUX6_9BACT|nr:hypothetical protein [Larkinella rosea]RRB04887.1 hypothetical protein EHT25_15625 [Larkinella rosea]